MRKLIVITAVLLAATGGYAADDLLNRPDLYGTAPAQWNFTSVNTTTTVKATPGVLHTVVISSAPNVIWSVRDGAGAGSAIVISTFPAAAALGTYTFDVMTSSGISILSGAANGNVTVTYR